MDNLYQIFNENNATPTPNNTQKKPRMSKEEFAKHMKEQRIALFTKANEQTDKAVVTSDSYLQYLNLQSRLGYTVTNTLLVMAQNPNVTLLKDITRWRENNLFIRKGEKGITILEPSGEFRRADGSIGVNYNPKAVFDISQLNGKVEPPVPPKFKTAEIVSALIYKTNVKPEVVSEDSTLPYPVFYDENSNKVYVRNGLEPNAMVNGLIREYCFVELAEKSVSRSDGSFIANSAGYMLAQKYGISNYDKSFINECVPYFSGMEQKEIKGELENIKSVFESVSERVEHGIYAQQQNRQENQPSRSDVTR